MDKQRDDRGREREVVDLPLAAWRLGLPYQTAWSRLLAGKLEGRRDGDRWVIYEDTLPPTR